VWRAAIGVLLVGGAMIGLYNIFMSLYGKPATSDEDTP
jgi:hypothetical protein